MAVWFEELATNFVSRARSGQKRRHLCRRRTNEWSGLLNDDRWRVAVQRSHDRHNAWWQRLEVLCTAPGVGRCVWLVDSSPNAVELPPCPIVQEELELKNAPCVAVRWGMARYDTAKCGTARHGTAMYGTHKHCVSVCAHRGAILQSNNTSRVADRQHLHVRCCDTRRDFEHTAAKMQPEQSSSKAGARRRQALLFASGKEALMMQLHRTLACKEAPGLR